MSKGLALTEAKLTVLSARGGAVHVRGVGGVGGVRRSKACPVKRTMGHHDRSPSCHSPELACC